MSKQIKFLESLAALVKKKISEACKDAEINPVLTFSL